MATFGQELLEHADEIVKRWYQSWRNSPHPHHDVGEQRIKDNLPLQLRVLAEQLQKLATAEHPERMWKDSERLDPEVHLYEGIPIETVVLGYKLLVEVVRQWVEEHDVEVSFAEFTYFYDALFELVAEAVRRYTKFQHEEVTRERAQYLAGVTHQMRSPLSALSLAVQHLEEVDPPIDADVVEKARRNVRRLQVLVDGVMRLERFKPDEIPVRPQELAPARLIEELVSDQEPRARSKGLRLEVQVNQDLRMTLDPELFRDALGNLLDNAIKYTRSGFVRIEVEEQPEHVSFRVADSGPGISDQRKKELFSPVRPEASEGVGIGLAVVHTAVVAQRGEVGVESELGAGACFWFRLPKVVRPNEPAPRAEP